MSYRVESNVWAEFIKEKFPDATKVALLTFNNDFGKTYKTALEELLPAAGLEIVADVVHEPTSDLSNEVTQLLAAGPDVIIGGTTSTFCTNLMTLARQGGFTGPIINSYTCQAIQQFMVPAGEAAANVHTLVQLKDPADPAYAEDENVQQYLADVQQYGAGVDPTIGNVSTGYNAAFLIIDALTRAAETDGGLTRANLMNAFWSLDLEVPLALGGIAQGRRDDGRLRRRVRRHGRVRPGRTELQGGRRRRGRRRRPGRAVRRLSRFGFLHTVAGGVPPATVCTPRLWPASSKARNHSNAVRESPSPTRPARTAATTSARRNHSTRSASLGSVGSPTCVAPAAAKRWNRPSETPL